MMKFVSLSAVVRALLLAVITCPVSVQAQEGVIDIIHNRYHGKTFLEIGYFYLDSLNWAYTDATFTNFTDPLVFLSLPDVPGETSSDGFPAIARLRNVKRQVLGHHYSVTSFEAKIYLANDSYCSSEWYTPVAVDPPAAIVWMVVERGAWDLTSHNFFVGSGDIYRLDSTYNEYNYPKVFTPSALDGTPTGFATATDVGAVTQIQTLVYDRFLLLRGRTIFRNAVRLMLVPFDTADPAYYRMVNPNETFAFILFKSGYVITCKEKLTLETRLYNLEITYIKKSLNFQNSFLRPPGVFGLIQSTIGQDSVGLRVFNRNNNSADFITQEDQCFDMETEHTTPETVAVLITGQVAFTSNVQCNVVFDNPRPTAAPSASPSASPTEIPTARPTARPSTSPSVRPSASPTAHPTATPSGKPSSAPTSVPSAHPSAAPTARPSIAPTALPSAHPTARPSARPTAIPTAIPSVRPTVRPSARPSTQSPTAAPTDAPLNHTEVVIVMRGNFNLLWGGPKFVAASVSNSSLLVGEPSLTENPKVRSFIPSEGGWHIFTADFNSAGAPNSFDEHDLKCKVYWSVTIQNITSNSSVTWEGTFQSLLVLRYDYDQLTWSVEMTENMLTDGYVPCVPSSAPTARPTAAPTGRPTVSPTAVPTANPTLRPTAKPTANPTRAPTRVPTAFPTLAPTRTNNTAVDLFLRSNYEGSWMGVELLIQGVDGSIFYRKDPNPTNGNPVRNTFLPLSSGMYVVSAVLPPGVSDNGVTKEEFECNTYWEMDISRNDQLYMGTYNTTLIFEYNVFKDTWKLLFSENVINRYKPCFPSSAPTFRPSRKPTSVPTVAPSLIPTLRPTARPTRNPTSVPTAIPSDSPSARPTAKPTASPTAKPSAEPTAAPTARPTRFPTAVPTMNPTARPTRHPTTHPTGQPSGTPTSMPSSAPTYNSSAVDISMLVSYAQSWSGVHLMIVGPYSSVVFDNAGPESLGWKFDQYFPEDGGIYNISAYFPIEEPEGGVDAQELRCQIYWKLNFTGNNPDLIIQGTYETTVAIQYDEYRDRWTIISESGTLDAYDPCSPTPFPTVQPTLFNGNGGTYDMIANRYVLQPWMEIGYTMLDDSNWVSITGSFTNFYDPVVFMSLPNIAGLTSNLGYAASIRIANVTTTRTSSFYSETSWVSKIYLTNDSYCSKEWYTPQAIDPPIPLSWMIAERGAWNLSSRFFFVDKGPITRQDDSYFLYNMIQRENPYECDVFDAPCRFPDYITVNNIGAITQIQTLVYDRFLLVRAYALNRKQGLYLLTPHDSADPTYYTMLAPETMAFMHFQGGVSITCRESITIETSLHRVTHFRQTIPYRHNFTIPPGVFGMVSSVVGQDSVGLRAFDRTNKGASFITQEDKCFDEETNHTTEELVSIFVAGAIDEKSDFKCDIIHDYNPPNLFRDDGTYDMINKRYIDDVWLEIGYATVDALNWVSVTTSFTNFTDPIVFLSLPDIAGETSDEGYPAIGRLRNVKNIRTSNNNAATSFEAKLYLANDSYCSKQWYTPVAIRPIPLNWMVAERGAWNLSANFFFVDTANIYRDDHTYNEYNHITVSNPVGCTSKYVPCAFPDYISVDRIGAITQIQTLRYDRFLLVRGFSLNRRIGKYILTPHDSDQLVYYELWESEVMGFMHFQGGVNLNCKEELSIETAIYKEAITNLKVLVPYSNTFRRPPGVFGQIMTTIGRDSVGLRAFNRSTSGSHFITQEDQCFDEETAHTTPETVALFITGSVLRGENQPKTNFTCNMRYNEPKFVPNGGTYDMIADGYVDQPWLEFGYTRLDDVNFVSISTSCTNFRDPVVFISLPDIAGATSDLGYPAVARIKNVKVNRTSSSYSKVTFDAKIFLANGSFCSRQWYTPKHIAIPLPVSWLVAERGAWNLSNHFFFVDTGPITRDDSTYNAYNMKRVFNPTGCDQTDKTQVCGFPDDVPTEELGTMTQLQTIIYDRFLLVRGFSLVRKGGVYLLTPHDSTTLSYYTMLNAETLGFMHFRGGLSISCREKVTLETKLYSVTNIKVRINYQNNYTTPPGVFGVVSSVLGQDSVGLRAFDRTVGGASFITQEDQCVDQETQHTSSELVSILITGEVSAASDVKCDFIVSAEPTRSPTGFPSTAAPSTRTPTHAPSTASPSTIRPTMRPTRTSEFATNYPSAPAQFVTNIPTVSGQFHTEAPSLTGQYSTRLPTRVEQFTTRSPTTIQQFATDSPTIYTQFHTEAPTTTAQFETSKPTTLSQFHTQGPTRTSQFATPVPTSESKLYTYVPTPSAQFVTPAPSRVAQFRTLAPNVVGSGTSKPSKLSEFFTEAPSTPAQFHTNIPTRTSQFSTEAPTKASQLTTTKPSTVSNFYSFIPTRSAQFSTSSPTAVSKFSTLKPTTSDQFVTQKPSLSDQFRTPGPTPTDQFVTAAPTAFAQFRTAVPSTASKFYTTRPSRSEQFHTSSPTTVEQFGTSRPTLNIQFSTGTPSSPTQFLTQSPTAPENFHTQAPTTVAQHFTEQPSVKAQFKTALPSSGSAFVTNAPTKTSQFITTAPTPTAQHYTLKPTTTVQFSTRFPTLAAQFVTNRPSTVSNFHTEAPSRVAQFSTRSPTAPSGFVTRKPTTVAQFSTSLPTSNTKFHTNSPTLTSQYQVKALTSTSPTTTAQFVTSSPTLVSQFNTRHPSRVAQYSTPSPTTQSQHYTRHPTTASQLVTNIPTLAGQFHTSVPTRPSQFATRRPTTTEQFLTRAPTPSIQFVTYKPTTTAEFHTNIPTTTLQFETSAPTRSEQFPPSLLPPQGTPTPRPTGLQTTPITIEAYSDIYNSNCAYWLSDNGRRIFKRGIIATQPSTPQPLLEEDVSVTDCVLVSVGRRNLRGLDDNESRGRMLQATAPRVIWRVDTIIEYFGYDNSTKYYNDFRRNFLAALQSDAFISAMQAEDPQMLADISSGSDDTVFGPYYLGSDSKSNGVYAESKKYFWPILIASLFCCCCLCFLLLFLFFKKLRDGGRKTSPEEEKESIVIRETTIVAEAAPALVAQKQTARHQVRISAQSVASPIGAQNVGRGRLLSPGAAKSYKEFSHNPAHFASDPEHSEKLQLWAINLQQSNETYRESLELPPRDDELSLMALLTAPRLPQEQIDLLIDFAEELYSDCESLFGRLHGVIDAHGSMSLGRIRQTRYTQRD